MIGHRYNILNLRDRRTGQVWHFVVIYSLVAQPSDSMVNSFLRPLFRINTILHINALKFSWIILTTTQRGLNTIKTSNPLSSLVELAHDNGSLITRTFLFVFPNT